MLPNEWELQSLEQITCKKIVYGIVQAGPHVPDGVPYIKSSDVGGVINTDNLQRTSTVIHNKYRRSSVHPGDIVFSLRGNTGDTSIVPSTLEVANLTQGTARISVDLAYCRYFIRAQLGSYSVRKQIHAYSKGSTFTEISLEELRRLKLLIPPLLTQRKIADILGTWERAIETVEALITTSQAQKKALMQQLLIGKRRLPGFSGEWKSVALAELGEFKKGKGITKAEVREQGIPCVRYGEIYTRHAEYIREFYSFIDEAAAEQSQRIFCGDLLFTCSGETAEEIGKCTAFLGEATAFAGGDIIIFSPRECDSKFLAYLMNSAPIVRQKSSAGQGNSVVHIGTGSLSKLQFDLPPLPEQTAIAEHLDELDGVILNLQAQLLHLQTEKSALMQQLLTGKRRVNVSAKPATQKEVIHA